MIRINRIELTDVYKEVVESVECVEQKHEDLILIVFAYVIGDFEMLLWITSKYNDNQIEIMKGIIDYSADEDKSESGSDDSYEPPNFSTSEDPDPSDDPDGEEPPGAGEPDDDIVPVDPDGIPQPNPIVETYRSGRIKVEWLLEKSDV